MRECHYETCGQYPEKVGGRKGGHCKVVGPAPQYPAGGLVTSSAAHAGPKSHFVAFRNSCRGAGARGGLVQSSVSNETSDWGAGPHLVGLVVQVVERIFFLVVVAGARGLGVLQLFLGPWCGPPLVVYGC